MIQSDYPAQLATTTNTAAAWNETNPILFEAEIGIESDTKLFKVGDGITAWRDLPYSKSSLNQLTPGEGIYFIGNTINVDILYDVIREVEDV